MNIKELKEIIQIMNENGLSELEIEKDGQKVRLKRNSLGMVETAPVAAYIPQPSSAPATNVAQSAPTTPAKPIDAKNIIKAPMVGTFYASPSPDAPAYVAVGTVIEPGKVVCIIEAMKLMNEIKAEIKGKIAEIYVNNGDPVEFGQPIFRVE